MNVQRNINPTTRKESSTMHRFTLFFLCLSSALILLTGCSLISKPFCFKGLHLGQSAEHARLAAEKINPNRYYVLDLRNGIRFRGENGTFEELEVRPSLELLARASPGVQNYHNDSHVGTIDLDSRGRVIAIKFSGPEAAKFTGFQDFEAGIMAFQSRYKIGFTRSFDEVISDYGFLGIGVPVWRHKYTGVFGNSIVTIIKPEETDTGIMGRMQLLDFSLEITPKPEF